MTAVAIPRASDWLAARTRTLFVLWTTYGSFYLCRTNFGPAVPSMRHGLGFTALQIGFLLGAVKLGYAIGQLVNGQLTERYGARRILGIGMMGSSVATLLLAAAPSLAASPGLLGIACAWVGTLVRAAARTFGLAVASNGPLPLMLLLAFANGWFQAGGWAPCVKIAGHWFAVDRRGRTMGVLGTSLTLGSALSILVVGALLHFGGGDWRVAFVVPPFLLLASWVHTMLRLRERPPGDGGLDVSAAVDRLSISGALRTTVGNPRIWILALALFGVDAVRYGFLDWAPGHLAEMQGSSASAAAVKTAVFPLAGAVGALSSGWLTDRLFGSRRAPVCALLLGGLALLTVGYRTVVEWGAVPTIVCLGLAGFCVYGAQILLVGTAAQDFARRGATAAAAGFVDFMGHVGAFSGDVVTAFMLKRHGWGGAITWWASAAFAAALLVATLWRARPIDSTLPNLAERR
jgi:MFS transporter, OPA family, glycerol-3-phosphate transporter